MRRHCSPPATVTATVTVTVAVCTSFTLLSTSQCFINSYTIAITITLANMIAKIITTA